MWSEETGIFGLGDLKGGSFFSYAADVSDDGGIVVGDGRSAIGQEAVIWDPIRGLRRLEDVLHDLNPVLAQGWHLTDCRGISGDGTVIVGNGINPVGLSEAWIVTLPRVTICPHSPLTAVGCGRSVCLVFDTSEGWRYQLQQNTSLEPQSWQPVGTSLLGDGSWKIQYLVPLAPRMFYRLSLSTSNSPTP